MDFFENLKEKITTTARGAKEKGEAIVEITKRRAAIAEKESEISKNFRHMGEALYEAYKTGEDAGDFPALCAEIDDAYAQIEELSARARALRNVKVCPVCKKEMDKDAVFCSICGAKF